MIIKDRIYGDITISSKVIVDLINSKPFQRLKHISQEDFFTTDDYLMEKLEEIDDPKIKGFLNRLKSGREFIYAEESVAEFYLKNKPRSVDPLVEVDNKLQRLSDIVPSIKFFIEEFKERYKYIGVKQL